MRFPSRQFSFFAPRGKGSTSATLSTLLLAALCLLLAAPASQAASRDEVHAAILTRVLAASASSSQLSALETRQVRVLLSRLEKSDSQLSISQLTSELARLEVQCTPAEEIPFEDFRVASKHPLLLTPHLAAQISGIRTNSYLE